MSAHPHESSDERGGLENAAMPIHWWEDQGYPYGRYLRDGMWVAVIGMVYTWRVALCTEDTVLSFHCYPRKLGLDNAIEAAEMYPEIKPGYTRMHPS